VKFPALRVAFGAVLGLVSAGAAVAVGELVAVGLRPTASPIIAVGNRFILLTPESVRRWAIREFGTNDKHALLTGIYVSIAVLAVLVGLLAMVRIWYGLAGIATFGAVGIYSALTAHAHRDSDAVPSAFALLAGVAVMYALHRQLNRPRPEPRPTKRVLKGEDARQRSALMRDRRQFLSLSAVTAAFAVVGGFAGRSLQTSRASVAKARAAITLPKPASPAPALANGTDLGKSDIPFVTPNSQFYRIDTALSVPQIDPDKWKLRIHGRVEHEMTLTYADILARPMIERWITLCCVSNEVQSPNNNLISTARFQGIRLADLLREAGVQAGADQLVSTSSDGMTIGSPTAVVMDGRDAMLAVAMNGVPLPPQHGFPVRMLVPGLYGYVSACKWIVDIEATTFAQAKPYWVAEGWIAQAPVQLESRIDTPENMSSIKPGAPITIAGVAWDQHVGVSKVEVQIDRGEWQAARLAPVPSTDTWRQWVAPWMNPTAGPHIVTVRAYDATGKVQTANATEPFPGAASGYHSIRVTVGG
jgi:DMSO/TMAO reductase YedYZ molybdopterin-dependent catalytic subunit